MFNKFWAILFLYSAVAILLGHNFIPHHHHLDQNGVSHHHNDGHSHDNDSDPEDESDDWTHLFSGIQHRAEGLNISTGHDLSDNLSKQIPQFTAVNSSNFIVHFGIIEARQNAPPHIVDDDNSHNYLPCGLRAPPFKFV